MCKRIILNFWMMDRVPVIRCLINYQLVTNEIMGIQLKVRFPFVRYSSRRSFESNKARGSLQLARAHRGHESRSVSTAFLVLPSASECLRTRCICRQRFARATRRVRRRRSTRKSVVSRRIASRQLKIRASWD